MRDELRSLQVRSGGITESSGESTGMGERSNP